MIRPLTCPKCGARASIAEDIVGFLDWGYAEIGDDGVLRPADPEPSPPVVMADNGATKGLPRGICDAMACGYQWRTRRRFDPVLPRPA